MSSALTSFILARRAGLKADFPREYKDWEQRRMILLPSPITSTADPFLAHVHTDFYERAKKYVEQGGNLYASIAADGAAPDMAALFGARMVDRALSSEVVLKIVAPFGDLKPGDTFHFTLPSSGTTAWGSLLEVTTGKIIAVDQDGQPALVANTLGKGKTLLSAYPLEHYLAGVPGVFDKPETTERIYRAFRDWVGVKPAFSVDRPEVEATSLVGDRRGYVVLVNHSPEEQTVTVTTAIPVRALAKIGEDGPSGIRLDGASWKMKIGAYEGAIVEWKQ